MPISSNLWEELVKAKSQPSRAYRTAQAGINAADETLAGYLKGQEIGDSIFNRQLQRQTLGEALPGLVPDELTGLPVAQAKNLVPLALAKAALDKSNRNPMADFVTKYNLAEQGRRERQQRQQDFIRSMVGAKGNKDAVSEAQDALNAANAMQSLNDELDKLSPAMARVNSTVASKVLEPKIAAKKAQILLYAGFSRGGKQLTGTELGVVVDALTPTGFDNAESRHLKNKVFQDWALGKVDLSNAAKLLGPAGVPLMKIAQDQRLRQDEANKRLLLGGSGVGGNDLNELFDAVNQ